MRNRESACGTEPPARRAYAPEGGAKRARIIVKWWVGARWNDGRWEGYSSKLIVRIVESVKSLDTSFLVGDCPGGFGGEDLEFWKI